MENKVSDIYFVYIYGQLHLEPQSTVDCDLLQNFYLGGGKNDISHNSLRSLLFHLHYIIKLNTN